VSSKKENAFAAGVGALEVFKAVVDDDAGDIFTGVAGEKADFCELASERDELAAKQAAALALRHFREGDSQVTESDPAQASVNRIDSQSKGNADGAREWTREQTQKFYPGPD
jgi:hypothetical protein